MLELSASARRSTQSTKGLPTTQLQTPAWPASASSFAELVDRALADVRQVLVAEHLRLIQEIGDTPIKEVCEDIAEIMFSPSASQANSENKNEASSLDSKPEEPTDVGCNSKPLGKEPTEVGCNSKTLVGKELSGRKSWRQRMSLVPLKQSTSTDSHVTLFLQNLLKQGSEDMSKSRSKQDLKQRLGERLTSRFQGSRLEILDTIMGFVIVANGIAIGASCDTRDWKQGWLIIDSIFALIFIGEFCVKSRILGLRGYLCGKLWFWALFEIMLIVFSLIEIVLVVFQGDDASSFNGSSLLRVLRLVRLTKMLRFARMHLTSELVMMVSGLVGGARTLLWAIVLTLFPLSLFTLVMRETLGEEGGSGWGAQSFATLPKSSFNTFRCLVIEDCADETGRPIFVLVSEQYGWGYGFLYSLTVMFMKFGLYNVIIAIFVEQTVQAAKYNEVYQKRARLNDQIMFYEKSLEMCEMAYSLKTGIPLDQGRFLTIEEIQSLELTQQEFNDLCKNRKFKELLAALDVAEEDQLDLFDTLDVDGGGTLDLGEICVGIGKLRGDARKSDIVAVILLAKHLNSNLADFKDQTMRQLESQRFQIHHIQKSLQSAEKQENASAEKLQSKFAEVVKAAVKERRTLAGSASASEPKRGNSEAQVPQNTAPRPHYEL